MAEPNARKLDVAYEPKSYRTQSPKFTDTAFAQQHGLGQHAFYTEDSLREA